MVVVTTYPRLLCSVSCGFISRDQACIMRVSAAGQCDLLTPDTPLQTGQLMSALVSTGQLWSARGVSWWQLVARIRGRWL